MKRISIFLSLSAVLLSAAGQSPYASRVYEFCPAPGQFINELPETDESTTEEELLKLVEEQICGSKSPGLISLGGWGGYVVFGFDHPVINVAGEYDFKIYGNAVLSNEERTGGSCEPGIVMVSRDENGDGLPNDQWYELAGSAYNDPETIHNYSVTYYRPGADASDQEYIRWTDSEGKTGFIPRNSYHHQSYWPAWYKEETVTFSGVRLPDNAVDAQGDQKNFVLMKFEYGYADNLPNNELPGFKIDWAVDSEGRQVSLPQIDFIKVYTGENQVCGWLGETSTEIAGAEDLHPEAENTGVMAMTRDSGLRIVGDNLVGKGLKNPVEIYSYSGLLLLRATAENVELDLRELSQGFYIARSGVETLRFVR